MPEPMTTARLRDLLAEFVAGYPAASGRRPIWREPLLVSATVDQRFAALPRIAAPDHLLPGDLLPGARSVVVFFIPFTKELAAENLVGTRPARSWGEAYVATNDLIARAAERLRAALEAAGHPCALTPATHNFDEVALTARWSHKHLAHLAGLGRFGVHCLLITPAGCVGRLGSLATAAELGDHPLLTQEHACLHKAGGKCLACAEQCPVGAVRPAGFDRARCYRRLVENHREVMADLPASTQVCAKCAMRVPCSYQIPVKG